MLRTKSQVPKKLREAALQEVGAAREKQLKPGGLSFDVTHEQSDDNDGAADRFDRENWVAKYPGQNSPHIGNGPGGPR